MRTNRRVRFLESKQAEVLRILGTHSDLTADEVEEGNLLMELIGLCIRDTQRAEIDEHKGTLSDLVELKYAVRLAGVLLQQTQDFNQEAMRGWQFGLPRNAIQKGYQFIYELVMGLGVRIAQIEDQFPRFADYFDEEREEYRRLCEAESMGQKPLQKI